MKHHEICSFICKKFLKIRLLVHTVIDQIGQGMILAHLLLQQMNFIYLLTNQLWHETRSGRDL